MADGERAWWGGAEEGTFGLEDGEKGRRISETEDGRARARTHRGRRALVFSYFWKEVGFAPPLF